MSRRTSQLLKRISEGLVEWHLVHRRYNIEWRVFHYGDTVYFAKIYFFARIFELIIQSIISGEWRRERERGYKGRKRERGYKKKPRCEGRGNEKERNPKRVGPAPSRRPHIVKDRIPLSCLDIGTVILIEAMSWAAVVSFYFECLSDFELISKFFLVHFIVHCFFST